MKPKALPTWMDNPRRCYPLYQEGIKISVKSLYSLPTQTENAFNIGDETNRWV